MIPKIIHYCWFGKNPLPPLAKRCIESWKTNLPDYMIKEWNEDNFDVNMLSYTKDAYLNKKYAFVSDVARLYALYKEGGIYLDTDVEVINSFDQLLKHIAFVGFENNIYIGTGIIASEKGGKWVKDNLNFYNQLNFINDDGSLNLTPNVKYVTNYMFQHGFEPNNSFQDFTDLVTLYPQEYFSPLNKGFNKYAVTKNTICIHYYAASWTSNSNQRNRKIANYLGPVITKLIIQLKRFLVFNRSR